MSRGFTRRFVRSTILSAAVSLAIAVVPSRALAQAAPENDPSVPQDIENARFTTTGIIASNAVYVRCGPGDNYYPTQKLDKGAKVKVVGAKFDWLKIEPPDESFCYVAKLYVDRHGDGKVGRVNKDSINVRAGSHLSALKIGILTELHQGEQVEITGEEQEYFKIKPPKGAYLYVNKKFVEPDPNAQPEPQAQKTEKTETPKQAEASKTETPKPTETVELDNEKSNEPAKTETAKSETPKPEIMKPDQGTQPEKPSEPKPTETTQVTPQPAQPDAQPTPTFSRDPKGSAPETANTPKPESEKPKTEIAAATPEKPPEKTPADWTPEHAEAEFDQAEADLYASRNLPVNEMPAESLLQRYEALARTDKLPESMRRVAEARVPGLQARATAKAEIARLRNGEESLRQKQVALKAEQEELQRRIAERTIKIYTAVGTLQPSSLQRGAGGTLYRITDPSTGRTVCYLRAKDNKPLEQLGQFVGIRGEITQDPRLGARVLLPTEITPIDPGKVHTTITAQIIPPSLIPREASTDPNQ